MMKKGVHSQTVESITCVYMRRMSVAEEIGQSLASLPSICLMNAIYVNKAEDLTPANAGDLKELQSLIAFGAINISHFKAGKGIKHYSPRLQSSAHRRHTPRTPAGRVLWYL